MEDDQQFCLRWNNHQSTLVQNFDTLLESGTLVDCTLAAEGRYLKAHKVVLSACSPYFEGLLSEHYDKHPIFILKDVTYNELKAMMDYMYRGEVNIGQDQLTPLLKAAESLQIRGLSDNRTGESRKADSRPQKTVSQPTAPSLDIPHSSSGLTIEKNRVPRQTMAQSSVGDLPEDTASPQVSKGISSREGSQSPLPRKRKRLRRRSAGDDTTTESQDASNSSDMPQQPMGGPSLGITPVAEERVHADPTDSLGRSALMTQLTKPADEMLQLPLEKPEPSDNLVEPKSEYLEEPEEGVEDLTLDDDMNDLEMEQDNNRAGPSHDSSQHPAGLGAWHVTGDRSNAGGVVGSVGGSAPGSQDEVFLAAQEAVQAHRDSQEKSSDKKWSGRTNRVAGERETGERARRCGGNFINATSPTTKKEGPKVTINTETRNVRSSTSIVATEKRDPKPSTSTAETEKRDPKSSTSTAETEKQGSKPSTSTAGTGKRSTKRPANTAETEKQDSKPSTSTAETEKRGSKPSTSTAGTEKRNPTSTTVFNMETEDLDLSPWEEEIPKKDTSKPKEVVLISDSTDASDDESSSRWTNSKNVARENKAPKYKCPYCGDCFEYRYGLKTHIMKTCLLNPDSKTRKEAGMYRCELCGRRYGQLKCLRHHQRNECQKTVTCPQCFTVMKGSVVTERHKLKYCINKRREPKVKQENKLSDELFIDDSSDELS